MTKEEAIKIMIEVIEEADTLLLPREDAVTNAWRDKMDKLMHSLIAYDLYSK